MKLKYFLVAISSLLCSSQIHAENVKASVIFKKWLDTQEVFPDIAISDAQNQLNDNFVTTFKNRYELLFPHVTTTLPLLSSLTNNLITNNGYSFKPPLDQAMRKNFENLYHVLEHKLPEFIAYLSHVLPNLPINDNVEQQTDATIERNVALARLLLVHNNAYYEQVLLMAFANRVFEYCFDPKTHQNFQSMLLDQTARPAVNFLFSIMWNFLVGEGWKDWSKSSIDLLKQRADQGNEIVYLAGGNDIFALITHGIYNIRIIDPFLSTQARYYADGWEFFIRSIHTTGINDEIHFGALHNHVTMKRVAYTEGESFFMKLSNDTIAEIKKSTTTWNVYDLHNNRLGSVVFERRLVNQNDFIPQENKTLLISYNELTYAATPTAFSGWGIDIAALPSNLEIIVKQLRRPVTKEIINVLRLTTLINFSDIKFINLGSNPQ